MASVKREKRAKVTDFTSGPIVKPLLLFALPVFLGNIFNAMYNLVDSVVVGQFVGANALAAVGCCFAVSMICISVFAGFGIGSGVLTAQMFGAKRMDQLTATVNTAYIGGFIIGGIMIIVGEIIAVPLLKLMNTPEAIMEMATDYLRIFLLGCTSQLYYYMGSSILRGMGDAKWPTYALVICAVLNIILDLLFVIVIPMGCAGVALATVLAQTISGIAVLIRVYTGGYGIKVTKQNFRIDPMILKMILRIGIPGALNMLITSVGTLVIQAYSNGFGEVLVAANSIVGKVENFALMPIFAICEALTMFVGQNLGAGEEERCNRGMKSMTGIVIACGAVVAVVCYFGAGLFCRAFVSEPDVIAMGIEAIHIIAFFYIFSSLHMSLSYTIEGAGATRPLMIISAIGIVLRIIMCYFFAVRTGMWQGLFWATNAFYVIMSIIYALYTWKGNWKKFVQVTKHPEEGIEA